jgi:hypothetical protein
MQEAEKLTTPEVERQRKRAEFDKEQEKHVQVAPPRYPLLRQLHRQSTPKAQARLAIQTAHDRRQELDGRDPIISLRDADLREADLGGADLRRAVLSFARLSAANLRLADLSGADLREADLSSVMGWTEKQLTAARCLEGATMPNAQKYEDWLKDRVKRQQDE